MAAPNVKIRYGTALDNVILSEFGRKAFDDTFRAENDPDNMAAYLTGAFSPEKQAAELVDPASVFLMAEIEGALVGFARLLEGESPAFLDAKKPIELVRIYAGKEWIGQGVGSALMRESLEEAVRKGCDVIWLGVWEQNERAIRFYYRWGFHERGRQEFLLGSDRQTDLVLARSV